MPDFVTPREEIMRDGCVSLWRFRSASEGPAVLLLPPLMVRSYVFDLDVDRSLAAYLLERGCDVYLADFGVPGPEDAQLGIEDYVLRFLPRMVAAIDAPRVSLCGYCMGGLFALLHAAADPKSVHRLALLACPVDFEKMGIVRVAAQRLSWLLNVVGNVPSFLPAAAMRMVNPVTWLRHAIDRLLGHWRNEHEALDVWMSDFVPGPHEAFREYLHDLIRDNALMRGGMQIGGRRLALRDVRCPILSLAGEHDPIATPESCRPVVDAIAAARFEIVPGGHVGMLVGSRARAAAWPLLAEWLQG